jgi:hypothetical protein
MRPAGGRRRHHAWTGLVSARGKGGLPDAERPTGQNGSARPSQTIQNAQSDGFSSVCGPRRGRAARAQRGIARAQPLIARAQRPVARAQPRIARAQPRIARAQRAVARAQRGRIDTSSRIAQRPPAACGRPLRRPLQGRQRIRAPLPGVSLRSTPGYCPPARRAEEPQARSSARCAPLRLIIHRSSFIIPPLPLILPPPSPFPLCAFAPLRESSPQGAITITSAGATSSASRITLSVRICASGRRRRR